MRIRTDKNSGIRRMACSTGDREPDQLPFRTYVFDPEMIDRIGAVSIRVPLPPVDIVPTI
jgi:hypothetical protein